MRIIRVKSISLLLVVALTLSLLTAIPVIAEETDTSDSPVLIVDWENFYQNSSDNQGSDDVAKKTQGTDTDGTPYVQIDVKQATGSASGIRLNYTAFPSGQFKTGDSVLFRAVARSVNADGSAGQMQFRLGKSAENYKNSESFTVPTTWTELFGCVSAGSDSITGLYCLVGQKNQTIQIKDFEVINYGSSVDISTLPSGSRDATAAPSTSWEIYCAGVKPNSTAYVSISKTVGQAGLFDSFLRIDSPSVGNGYSARAANFTPDGIKAGDTVLLRFIARSANEDGSGGLIAPILAKTDGGGSTDRIDYPLTPAWTEYFVPLSLASNDPNRLYLRIGHKIQTVDVAYLELINYGSSVDISTLPSGYRVLVEPAGLSKDLTSALTADGKISGSASYTFQSEDLTVHDGDMLLFNTVVRSETAACHIRLTAEFSKGSTVMEYPIPVQNTRIGMPITTDGYLKSFTIEALDGTVILSEATVENKLTATQEDMMLQSGMHMLEDQFTDYALSETGVGAGKTTDLVCHGNYTYSIGSGNLVITDMTDPDNPVVTGSVSGLGDTRQIALCASGTDVMVTARGYGAWIINVADPENPVIRAHYDSVEMATGIDIEGNYAFISCRQYGVDVVDLTDLDAPKHVCILRTGEVQSCKVVDNILYAGLWAECRVDIFDVSDPANPSKLGSAALSGKGDGTAIYKDGGKTYLFAATGHHNPSLPITTPLSDLRYGQGNGLDVYDVTDPSNPVWLSTSKTDGRFYSPSYDFWSVELSQDESGKLYAYLSCTNNGVFVYDMSDLKAPIRLAHAYINIPKDSVNYKTFIYTNRTVTYPFDRTQLNWGAVGAVAVTDGRLYLAGITTDLIALNSEELFHAPLVQSNSTAVDPSGNFYAFDGAGLSGYKSYSSGTQIHSAVVHGDHVFAAGGADGILIFDTDLTLIKTIPTQGNCYDVQIFDGVVYAAEGVGGLAAYTLEDTTLTQQWRYSSSGRAIKQVRLSATGKFAMLHVGSNRGEIVRLTDLKQLVSFTASSQMYHHNVINGVVGGRYMSFWANSSNEQWYDFGENDSFDEPVLLSQYDPTCNMTGGMEAVGDLVLSMGATGYKLYDPSTLIPVQTTTPTGLTTYKPGQNITGKPSEHRGTLITTNRITGAIYIMDASTLTDPKLLKSITVPGHPIIAAYGEDAIYIPLGYQGIMKLDLAPFDVRQEQAALSLTVETDVTMSDGGQTAVVTGGSGTGKLSFAVNDPALASVDATGKLTYLRPGTFTLTVTKAADETYKSQTATVQITVSSLVLTGAEVTLSQSEFIYDGAEKKPAVTVTLDGKTLSESVEYAVSYQRDGEATTDLCSPGTVTMVISGISPYSGTLKTSYTIIGHDLSLKFTGASVTLYSDLGVNFKVNNSALKDYTDPFVKFNFGGQDITDKDYVVDSGKCVFRFRDIAPHRIGDTITATLYAYKDGVLCQGATVTYSVKQYCYNMLETYNDVDYPAYGQLRTLLVDLLNYGAAAQTYTKYNTDALVNGDLLGKQLDWGTATDPAVSSDAAVEDTDVEAPTVTWEAVGLTLDEAVTVRLGFIAESTEGLSVKFTLNGQVYEVTEFKDMTTENGRYVYFSELNAAQMRDEITAAVYRDGQQVSNTVHYNVEAYVAKHAADANELGSLVKAMIRYGDAAEAYAK